MGMEFERSRLVRRLLHGQQDDRVAYVGDTGVTYRAAAVHRDALELERQALITHLGRLSVAELELPVKFHAVLRGGRRTNLRNTRVLGPPDGLRRCAQRQDKQSKKPPVTHGFFITELFGTKH